MHNDDPTRVSGDDKAGPAEIHATRTSLGQNLTPFSSVPLPASIGRYRVLRKLGEGGMGVVYEAEQQSPRRNVAVKVVRGGRTIDEVQVRMFQREVDTLARLDHPDIAAIYESGCTEEGQHFFAMELIQGKTLDAYLQTRPGRLDTAELRFRLGLFHRIAEAVHYAHQRGVIHRDLKPSNIVVTERAAGDSGSSIASLWGTALPGIKILDFGLARITEGDTASATMATEIGVIKGTLAYMSPEQAGGKADAIDVRTDVYALGVILYEMLSGQRPYDLTQKSVAEAVRTIEEQRPRPLRQAHPGLIKLDADIETIVQKALEKEPDRRYGSAAELAGDIVRYLSSEPILARPPSTIYQLRKLVARHRVPAALLASLLVLLVGFGVVTSFLLARALRAESQASQQASTATRALDFMTGMFEVSDPSQALGNVITAREVLDRGAERIERELADQPEIQATLMTTMGHVYGTLGLNDPAEKLLDRAVARRRELLGEGDERTLDAVVELAHVYIGQGRFTESATLLERGLATRGQPEAGHSRTVLAAQTTLADAYRNLGRFEDAERRYVQTLDEQRRELGPDDADTLTTSNNLSILYTQQGRFEEAEKLAREILKLQMAKHGPDHPESYTAKDNLATIYIEQSRFEEAETLLREAVASAARVAGPEHPDTMSVNGSLAVALRLAGRSDEALALAERIVEVDTRTRGEHHPATLQARGYVVVMLGDQGRYDEAEPLARQLVQDYRQILGPDHPKTMEASNNLAMNALLMGHLDEAERLLHEQYETRVRVLGPDHPDTAMALENYGNALYKLGRKAEVPALLQQVLDIRTRVLGENNPATSRTRSNLAVVLNSQGQFDKAQSILEHELELHLAAVGPDHPGIAHIREGLAEALSGQKKYAEAIPHLREVLRIERLTHAEEPDVAATLYQIAVNSTKAGNHTEAEAAIVEAIAIRQDKLGPDDPDTLLSQYWQAKILGAQGRLDEAAAGIAACYENSVRTKAKRYPLVGESAKLAAEFQEKLGNTAAAAEWRSKQSRQP